MAYTVKKLAQLSSISLRTLRFYDEIGLLKLAYYGDNNYRYYEEEQLLMLQQILFYRELGFSLDDIVQEIMRRHHAWVGWNPTREGYIGLSQRYLTPEFRKFYEQQHPELLEFIIEAMNIFSERELS